MCVWGGIYIPNHLSGAKFSACETRVSAFQRSSSSYVGALTAGSTVTKAIQKLGCLWFSVRSSNAPSRVISNVPFREDVFPNLLQNTLRSAHRRIYLGLQMSFSRSILGQLAFVGRPCLLNFLDRGWQKLPVPSEISCWLLAPDRFLPKLLLRISGRPNC